MAWLSRVNFIASDTLSFSDINNLGNDIRAWGGNVNGGGYVLSNVVLSAFDLSTCFGLPISTGVSGLGTGVATFLGTPSSANLAAALTDETGTGANVFATSPTIVTPTVTTSAVIPLVNGGTAVSSTLTLQSTSGAGSSDAIIFKTASQSEKMRITTGGNVGIGTVPGNVFSAIYAAPKAIISASDSNTGAQLASIGQLVLVNPDQTTGNTAALQFAHVGTNGNVYTNTSIGAVFTGARGASYSASDLVFTTGPASNGNAERVRITSSGNVGIGTASPLALRTLNLEIGPQGTNDGAAVIINKKGTGVSTLRLATQGAASGFDLNFNFPTTGYLGIYDIAAAANRLVIDTAGNVGIGTTGPNYKLEISTDSAGKPGVGGLWTVVSDERIKTDITPADLDRCYEIVKSVPLKHFGFAPGVYTDDQIQDKHSLGWIAQDVQKVFSKAVSVKPFTLKTAIPDGTEEYTEQDFKLETVEKTETSIQVIDGKPVQVSKVVTSENKVLLFDSVDVVDEAGAVVMDGDKALTYQMPRMVTKTRNKVRHDVIEDCLDLNGGQMIAALYGAVQAIMQQLETLKAGN